MRVTKKMTSPSDKHSLDRAATLAASLALSALVLAGGGVATLAVGGTGRPQRCEPQQGACGQHADAAVTAAGREQPSDVGQPSGRGARSAEGKDGWREPDGRRGRAPMAPFDFGWGGYGRGGTTDIRSPRPEEWEEVRHFMDRYSPRRQAALEELPDNEKKEQLKRYVFARYRSLQSLQRRDRAGYEQKLAQLEVEDQIFGLVSDWGAAGEADRAAMREALRQQVERLVDLELEERRRRIEWLRRELAEETQKLELDQQERDVHVDRRAARYADWADRWAARRAKKAQAEKQDAEREAARDAAPGRGAEGESNPPK